MKKMSLLCAGALLLISAETHAQWGWSNHLVTNDIPVISYPNSYADISDVRIMQDAVTTNGENGTSNFDPNTVFSIYSETNREYEDHDAGAWLIAKNMGGQTTLSRRINVDGHALNVSSLQYNGGLTDEVLVFTGSIVNHEQRQGMLHNFENVRMVYGTYNLTTDQVDMNYVDQVYGNDDFIVGSQGVGVREITQVGANTYMAIGQTGDAENLMINSIIPVEWWTPNAISGAFYPIGIIFTVGNHGSISEEHLEVIDMAFKPHSLSKAVNRLGGRGSSVYVGGRRILADPVTTCVYDPNKPWQHCETIVAPAAYTFDATLIGGNYDIAVDDGMYLTMDEYSGSTSYAGSPEFDLEIMVNDDNFPDSRNVILGGTYREGQISHNLKLGLMFFDMNIDLGSGDYSLTDEVKYDLRNSDPVYVRLRQILPNHGSDDFDVVFQIDDWQNTFGQVGRNSIGIMSLPKDDIGVSPLTFKSIYNDDTPATILPLGEEPSYNTPLNEADVNYVTGIKVFGGDAGDVGFTYLLADAAGRSSLYTRAHFDGAFYGYFECYDIGTAHESNPQSSAVVDDKKGFKDPAPRTTNLDSDVRDVVYEGWVCDDFPFAYARRPRLKSSTVNATQRLDINFLDKNLYKINLQEENVLTYQLFTISGKKVNSVLKSNNTLDVNNLATGIYILNIQTGENFYSEKLIVQ